MIASIFKYLIKIQLFMKNCLRILLLAAGVIFTQSLWAQTANARWQEMYDFHEVMSTTFHPAEEGNLQPLRAKADELYNRAKAWKAAKVPAGYNPAKTADTLKRLVKQCKTIRKAVKANKSDAELTTLITNAHEVFHEIMEKCRT